MTREEAQKILDEWIQSVGLKKHCLAVAQAMDWYARKFSEDRNKWWILGLLHDLDWEKYPDWRNGGHPYKAVEFLKERGMNEEFLQAVLGHASYTNIPRETLMAKTLFAVDELAGFIVAVALIKAEKSLTAVNVKSVRKRLKEKRFAAGVHREEIYQGAEEIGVSLEEHIENVIAAMREISADLGL